jgi:hypothetical protein
MNASKILHRCDCWCGFVACSTPAGGKSENSIGETMRWALVTLTCIGTVFIVPSANAIPYSVNRSWSNPVGGSASLVGTVDVPLGTYTLMNGGPNPFTSASLTLIVNGSPLHLALVDTSLIFGTGRFSIFATASSLIFDANGNGTNPADLKFLDPANRGFYAIGSDDDPAFQNGDIFGQRFVVSSVDFPNIFGTAASAPDSFSSTLSLLGFAVIGLAALRRRLRC